MSQAGGTPCSRGDPAPCQEEQRAGPGGGRRSVWVALLIVAATMLPYANSFDGSFVFDDVASIVRNPYLHPLWPPEYLWRSPDPSSVVSRPVVRATLALNYALSGLDTWSYHAFNLLVHVLAALTLFGVVRRTLLCERLRGRFGAQATGIALACTLLWALHPLQTQSVTYIIQRCESLTGLFFLLTLYCAIRGWESPAPGRWHMAAIASCMLGAGSKEVIAVAPAVVLIYDLVFVHRRAGEALRRSWWLYAGLVACSILVAVRSATVSVHPNSWEPAGMHGLCLLAQCEVLLYYLRLAVWPAPLVLDYFWPQSSPADRLPYVLTAGGMLAATAWALWRRHPLAVPTAWYFLIHLPSAFVARPPDLLFEHRMYLPLAAVVVLAVLGAREAGRRVARRLSMPKPQAAALRIIPAAAVCTVLAVFGALTAIRNRDYASELTIWRDTAHKRPENWRAQTNLAIVLLAADRPREAIAPLWTVPRTRSRHHAETFISLGRALAALGDAQEAMASYRRAVEFDPDFAAAHEFLGDALFRSGDLAEGIHHLRAAVRLGTDRPSARFALGNALVAVGQRKEGIANLREALRLKPDYAAARERLEAIERAAQGR